MQRNKKKLNPCYKLYTFNYRLEKYGDEIIHPLDVKKVMSTESEMSCKNVY